MKRARSQSQSQASFSFRKKAKRAEPVSRAAVQKYRPTYASGGFPTRKKTTLRFCLEQDLDASGGSAQVAFVANGPFQPVSAGTTHQPLGWDEWASVYGHYTVTDARMKVTAVHDDTTNNPPCMLAIVASPSGTFSGPTTTWVNEISDRSEQRMIGPYIGSGGPARTVSLALNLAKAIGVKDILDVDEAGASVLANPALPHFFHVVLTQINSNTPAISNPLLVEIEYDIVYQEPTIMTVS